MASVIDALFVTLGLDTREYEKKQKEVTASTKRMGTEVDKQTKLIHEHAKKAAGGFKLLKTEVLGALAAFGLGVGFKSFIESAVTGEAQMGRLGKSLGMSAHALAAWQMAGRGVGATNDAMTASMQNLSKGFQAAQLTGDSALKQAAIKYGFKISADPAETMRNLSAWMVRYRALHGEQAARMIASEAGVSDFNVQSLLLLGPQTLAKRYGEGFAATSGEYTQKSIEQAQELQRQWARLQEKFHQVTLEVFNRLSPVLSDLGEKFLDWLQHVNWDAVIAGVGKFIDKVQAIVHEMGGWKRIAEILGGILALKILAPLGSLVGTLAGAIPGVSGLALAFGSLGVAIAAAGGAWIGSELWKHLLEGNKAGDKIGEVIMQTLADLGDKDAQEALRRMHNAPNPTASTSDHTIPRASKFYHPERTDWYKSKEDKAVRYFESQGFSHAVAIGMAANIARESGFNAHAIGDHGKAFGLGQWHPARQADFARVMGLPIQGSSFDQQLAFYAHEVKNNPKLMQWLGRNPSAGAAAMLVSKFNERPANAESEMVARAKIAQNMVNAHIGAPSAGTSRLASSASPHTSTADIRISHIDVNAPHATDADGVAKGIYKAMGDNFLLQGYVTSGA